MQLQRPHLSSSKEVGKGQGYLMTKRRGSSLSLWGEERKKQAEEWTGTLGPQESEEVNLELQQLSRCKEAAGPGS